MSKIVAYTDGSYNKKTKKASYGVIILDENMNVIHTFGGLIEDIYLNNMRNVGGEIIAAQEAMKYTLDNGYESVKIYHDYTGVSMWPLCKWKTNNDCTKAYMNFYKEISKKIIISFKNVKGHSGDIYNDMADKVAKKYAGV